MKKFSKIEFAILTMIVVIIFISEYYYMILTLVQLILENTLIYIWTNQTAFRLQDKRFLLWGAGIAKKLAKAEDRKRSGFRLLLRIIHWQGTEFRQVVSCG